MVIYFRFKKIKHKVINFKFKKIKHKVIIFKFKKNKRIYESKNFVEYTQHWDPFMMLVFQRKLTCSKIHWMGAELLGGQIIIYWMGTELLGAR